MSTGQYHILVIPRTFLERWVRMLRQGRTRRLHVPLRRADSCSEVFWHAIEHNRFPSVDTVDKPALRVLFSRNINAQPEPGADCALLLGDGVWEGCIQALRGTADGWLKFDRVKLPGCGMEQIVAQRQAGQNERENADRWSRTAGALGRQAFDRLRRLRFVLVGCGRTGSLIASSLVRLGVAELEMADPDEVELHNLGEMGVLRADSLGLPKAQALMRALAALARETGTQLRAHGGPLQELQAAVTFARADVLFHCSDSDAVRVLCGQRALAWNLVLLDVGTGILFPKGERNNVTHGGNQTGSCIGADVRLISPGDGCLFCRGGVSNPRAAAEELLLPFHQVKRAGWPHDRPGSLRSLNQVAVGLAMRHLEEFVCGRGRDSTCTRIEWADDGQPTITAPIRWAPQPCSFCGSKEPGRRNGITALADCNGSSYNAPHD